MRRLATWSVVVLVAAVAVAAIAAAIVNNDSSPSANVVDNKSTTDLSLCDSKQLELSIWASGFAGYVVALRLSGAEPCNVGELHVTARVIDRNGKHAPTTVAPPQEFTGEIHPRQDLISTFDYTTPCRQKAPFSATVIAEGEVGSLRATEPVGFRRDPFTASPCKAH
jgi:hypothetical protein